MDEKLVWNSFVWIQANEKGMICITLKALQFNHVLQMGMKLVRNSFALIPGHEKRGLLQ